MKKLFGLFLLALAFLAPVNVARSTLVTLPGPIAYPNITTHFNANPGMGTAATLTATGHYLAYVLTAREDMVVSHVAFRTNSVTGTTPVATVTIETVDTGGLPSGTLWNAGGGGSTSTTGTLTSTTVFLQALAASATIPKGSVFAVKIAVASGTTPSVGISNINQVAVFQNANNLPYQVNNVGTPTKNVVNNSTANIALGSSSTTFYQVTGAMPAIAAGNNTFNNTNGAKRGLRFTIPMNARAVGVRLATQSSVGDYNVCLYDDAGAELNNSCTAYVGADSPATTSGPNWTYFDNTVTLTAGTTYRIAIEPTTATNVAVGTIQLPSASYRGASLLGTTGHYTTFVSGSWTDTATDTVPLMDVLIDQIDNGAGTGGGSTPKTIGG